MHDTRNQCRLTKYLFPFLSRITHELVSVLFFRSGSQIGQSVDQQPYGITFRLSHRAVPQLLYTALRIEEARLLHGHTLPLKISSSSVNSITDNP